MLYWYCYNNVVITILLLCHCYNATKADEDFNNEFANDIAIANNYYNDVVIINTNTNTVDNGVAIVGDCYD